MERKRLIKKLWALAHSLFGVEKEEKVYSFIGFVYGRERLRELSDIELQEVVENFIYMLSERECPGAPGEWRQIRVLQKKVGWSDEHLRNYLKRYAHIEAPRFMTQKTAKLVIAALQKIYKQKAYGR